MLYSAASRFLLTSVVLLLGACGGDDSSPSQPPASDAFAEVDNAARAAYETYEVPMGLAVYDRDGNKVFERMYGDFAADRHHALQGRHDIALGWRGRLRSRSIKRNPTDLTAVAR